jgi:hypothetical protein
MLDEGGQLVDVLFAGQLSGLIRRRRDDEAAALFADPYKVAQGLSAFFLSMDSNRLSSCGPAHGSLIGCDKLCAVMGQEGT